MIMPEMLVPEDQPTVILQNVSNYLPNDTGSQPRRLSSSATLL